MSKLPAYTSCLGCQKPGTVSSRDFPLSYHDKWVHIRLTSSQKQQPEAFQLTCTMMRMALPAPSSRTSPYMPDTTYATASPMVISTPSSFWAPLLQAEHSST